MNSRLRGAIGVAKAIEYYTRLGKPVFVPVSDVSRYDLIVDDGNGVLLRVEVKTTTQASNDVSLITCGGNRTGEGKRSFISAKDCDRVFCVNLKNGVCKEFKASEVEGRSTVRLNG